MGEERIVGQDLMIVERGPFTVDGVLIIRKIRTNNIRQKWCRRTHLNNFSFNHGKRFTFSSESFFSF